ncbi:MAG: UDP-N-acetylglucosamine--N-acetylmuramyl-(pentapeptide) pyrophosphoryl-undecaprenol N-acetylglucosamine transferase, partial [Candidatus Buchananbacteria bacterium]|nr:UDP-N-acetylglucosamine--N-acetylmuramyl-(pentapeptide) pyrophosphoryl-undecaprenol N-acetylglucosamine transferase [Candidatus Buchananbacteria bacterium]
LPYKPIMTGKMRRYLSPLTIIDILKMPVGFFQSLWHIFWFMPDVVFAKGGYASIPGALVSKLLFIPLFIHESDSIPGLANRILGKMAKTVFISFNSSEKYFKAGKAVLTGNPVRKELLTGDRLAAIEKFGLDPNRKTILVAGGSQGAQKINRIILDSLVLLVKDFQIIHQCGESQLQSVKTELEKIIKEGQGEYADAVKANYKLYPFFDANDMALAYAAADVIISRAGANNISEIAMLGKPVILIPLFHGSRGEQLSNAEELAKFGGVYIEEENLTPHIIINQIQSLLELDKYNSVSAKLKTFAMPDAAQKISEVIFSELKI